MGVPRVATVAVVGCVNELADATGRSMDAVTEAAISPHWTPRPKSVGDVTTGATWKRGGILSPPLAATASVNASVGSKTRAMSSSFLSVSGLVTLGFLRAPGGLLGARCDRFGKNAIRQP